MRLILLVLLSSTAACKDRDDTAQPPAPPPAPTPRVAPGSRTDCDAAAAKLADVATNKVGDPTAIKRLYDAVRPVIATRCVEDGWSAETSACYAGLADTSGLAACRATLTPAQDAQLGPSMERAMRAAIDTLP